MGCSDLSWCPVDRTRRDRHDHDYERSPPRVLEKFMFGPKGQWPNVDAMTTVMILRVRATADALGLSPTL